MQILFFKDMAQFIDRSRLRVQLEITQYSNEKIWYEFKDENNCPVVNLCDYCFDKTFQPAKYKYRTGNCADVYMVKFKLINMIGNIAYLQLKVTDYEYNNHEFEFVDLNNNTFIAKGLI